MTLESTFCSQFVRVNDIRPAKAGLLIITPQTDCPLLLAPSGQAYLCLQNGLTGRMRKTRHKSIAGGCPSDAKMRLHSMVDSLSLLVLVLIFAVAAAVVWFAGIHLSNTTDVLSRRFKFGEALGGIIVLAVVTNLPEIAITISAALGNKLELAIGNILGGIALQTVVLVVLDAIGVGKKHTLTSQQSTLTPVLEGVLVIAMLTVVVMGHQLPQHLILARVTPSGFLLLLIWIVGVYLIGKARSELPWQLKGTPPSKTDTKNQADTKKVPSTGRTLLVFALAALATLAGGFALEESGDAIAGKIGLSGIVFGATVLAAATALPELSTGLASIKLKDYSLAVSDIFGGNAFLPLLFPLAVLISGKAVLPAAHQEDIYLTGLGILLTTVYLIGFLLRPTYQLARMGLDSLVVIVAYAVGMIGLFFIAH